MCPAALHPSRLDLLVFKPLHLPRPSVQSFQLWRPVCLGGSPLPATLRFELALHELAVRSLGAWDHFLLSSSGAGRDLSSLGFPAHGSTPEQTLSQSPPLFLPHYWETEADKGSQSLSDQETLEQQPGSDVGVGAPPCSLLPPSLMFLLPWSLGAVFIASVKGAERPLSPLTS